VSEKLIASARSKEAIHHDSSKRMWCQFYSTLPELMPEKAIQHLQDEAQRGADYMASDPYWRSCDWLYAKLDNDRRSARSTGFRIKDEIGAALTNTKDK